MLGTLQHPPMPVEDNADFKLLKVRTEDRQDAVNFLLSDFLCNEPLSMALAVTPEEGKPFFELLVDSCLSCNASYLIRGKGDEISAMAINKIGALSDDGTYDAIDPLLFGPKCSKLADLLNHMAQYLAEHREKCALPAKRDYLEIEILSVHSNWIGQGLAKKLLNASIEEAKSRGCAFAITVATNVASQQLFAKWGFETLHKVMHKEYLDKQGCQIFNCKNNPTDCAKLMVKRW
uniref:aralkylamine N-acetyltransferase n=1 Tax=Trichuris muris TaxID=70415 RepID=A0A5S6QZ06_TRIMR